MTGKTSKYLKINLVLFLIAIAVSAYMVFHHYELLNGEGGFKSFCSINQTIDCDAVNASAYSELAGIPLASLGLAYYLFAALLTIVGIKSMYSRRESLLLLLPFSLISGVMSLATLGIMLFALHKLCLMCMILHIVDFTTLALLILGVRDLTASSSYAKELTQVPTKRGLVWIGVGAAILLVTHGLASQLKRQMPFDEEAYLNEFRAQPQQTVPIGDSPRQGFKGENPPVQLVEFADFECPACGMAAKQMHRLVGVYGDKIQLVFKSFPLDPSCNPHITRQIHDHACDAAKAAHCAHKQGKFVEMYEQLFGNQQEINKANLDRWAKDLGLDMTAYQTCLSAPETQTELLKDMDLAKSLGLTSTPTFFVNGRKVMGAITEAQLKLLMRDMGK